MCADSSSMVLGVWESRISSLMDWNWPFWLPSSSLDLRFQERSEARSHFQAPSVWLHSTDCILLAMPTDLSCKKRMYRYITSFAMRSNPPISRPNSYFTHYLPSYKCIVVCWYTCMSGIFGYPVPVTYLIIPTAYRYCTPYPTHSPSIQYTNLCSNRVI